MKEKRGTSTDAALRLGWLFGTTPGFWMKLQTHYDPAPATTELRKVLETIRMLAA